MYFPPSQHSVLIPLLLPPLTPFPFLLLLLLLLLSPTLLHTPQQLTQHIVQQDGAEGVEVLSEHIHHSIEGMVTGGGHPLCFLEVGRGEEKVSGGDTVYGT